MKYRTSECRHEHETILTAVNCWRHSKKAEHPPHVYRGDGTCLTGREAGSLAILAQMSRHQVIEALQSAKKADEIAKARRQPSLFPGL